MKTFREFIRMRESGLMTTQGWPTGNKPSWTGTNIDPYYHQFGNTGATGTSPGAYGAGTGAGLGSKQPIRMKKMRKK